MRQDSTGQEISLATLKGTPFILDFFSSICTVCFKNLPKINGLQSRFGNRLKLVLVGIDDGKIRNIYGKFQQQLGLHLTVAYDKAVYKKMKVPFVPYAVWVDAKSVVRAVTGPEEVTADNIENFISGQGLHITAVPVGKIPFDAKRPFLVEGNGAADSSFLYRSVLSAWTPVMQTSYPPDITSSSFQNSFQVLGTDLARLYNYAYFGKAEWTAADALYGKASPFPVVETTDTGLFASDGTTGKNMFCYSLVLPAGKFSREGLQRALQKDLEVFSGFRAHTEKRRLPCWVLRAIDGAKESLRTKGGPQKGRSSPVGFAYANVATKKVIEVLQARFQDFPPFLDETGIGFNIDLSIEAAMSNFESVKNALAVQGLVLTREDRELTAIVIGEGDRD